MNSIGTVVPSPRFIPPASLMACTASVSAAPELTPNESSIPPFTTPTLKAQLMETELNA